MSLSIHLQALLRSSLRWYPRAYAAAACAAPVVAAQVVLDDLLPVPVGSYSMLTRLDLQFEHDPSSNAFATRVRSERVLPAGVSLPALRAASFSGAQKAVVEMQAAHIAAFAPQLQQLSVETLLITPAGVTPGLRPHPGGTAGAGPAVLPFCTHLACTNVEVEGITSGQQFGPAFAVVFPVLEVVALLPRFRYPAARAPLEVLMYAPIGLHPSHEEVPSAAVLSCCTSLRAIRIRRTRYAAKHWCGGNLSSLAALTKLTRVELRQGWFGSAAVSELGALTSLQSLWLTGGRFFQALPVVQPLPRLRRVGIPASALCGKCYGREQGSIVSLALKCRDGFEVFDELEGDDFMFDLEPEDGAGDCEHFSDELQACIDAFHLRVREAAAQQVAAKGHAAPPAGAAECDADSDCGSGVWGEYA
jgi:hypothetical protein